MRLARSALATLAFAAVLSAGTSASAASPDEEIGHLMSAIAGSPCAFIRNGVAYDGKTALAHVKDKYEYYRNEIRSAEDFIALAATKSVLSGRPYLVQCGARTMPAADWLSRELATFRQHP